ncbi:hypothetical protein B0H12DRAFT_1147776, partial [Mycena haematopus]
MQREGIEKERPIHQNWSLLGSCSCSAPATQPLQIVLFGVWLLCFGKVDVAISNKRGIWIRKASAQIEHWSHSHLLCTPATTEERTRAHMQVI